MTGLEKIVQDISNESKDSASATLEKARQEAEKIRSDAHCKAADECEAIRLRAEHEAKAVRERAASAADQHKRRAVLEAKQQIIGETMEAAYQKLVSLPQDEYFSLLLKIAAKYALPGEGEIIFSEKDLSRMPSQFETELNSVLKKGSSLKISSRTRKIDGGFILVYGGVEENCSFSALFDEKRDELQDRVQALLFAGA